MPKAVNILLMLISVLKVGADQYLWYSDTTSLIFVQWQSLTFEILSVFYTKTGFRYGLYSGVQKSGACSLLLRLIFAITSTIILICHVDLRKRQERMDGNN